METMIPAHHELKQRPLKCKILDLASKGALNLTKVLHQESEPTSLLLKTVLEFDGGSIAPANVVSKTLEPSTMPFASKIIREMLPDFERTFTVSTTGNSPGSNTISASLTVSKTEENATDSCAIQSRSSSSSTLVEPLVDTSTVTSDRSKEELPLANNNPDENSCNDDPYGVFAFLAEQGVTHPPDIDDFGVTLGTNPYEDAKPLEYRSTSEFDGENEYGITLGTNPYPVDKIEPPPHTTNPPSNSNHSKRQLKATSKKYHKYLHTQTRNQRQHRNAKPKTSKIQNRRLQHKINSMEQQVKAYQTEKAETSTTIEALTIDNDELASEMGAIQSKLSRHEHLRQIAIQRLETEASGTIEDIQFLMEDYELRLAELSRELKDALQEIEKFKAGQEFRFANLQESSSFWAQDFWICCVKKSGLVLSKLYKEMESVEGKIEKTAAKYGIPQDTDPEHENVMGESYRWLEAFEFIKPEVSTKDWPVPETEMELDDYRHTGNGFNRNWQAGPSQPFTATESGGTREERANDEVEDFIETSKKEMGIQDPSNGGDISECATEYYASEGDTLEETVQSPKIDKATTSMASEPLELSSLALRASVDSSLGQSGEIPNTACTTTSNSYVDKSPKNDGKEQPRETVWHHEGLPDYEYYEEEERNVSSMSATNAKEVTAEFNEDGEHGKHKTDFLHMRHESQVTKGAKEDEGDGANKTNILDIEAHSIQNVDRRVESGEASLPLVTDSSNINSLVRASLNSDNSAIEEEQIPDEVLHPTYQSSHSSKQQSTDVSPQISENTSKDEVNTDAFITAVGAAETEAHASTPTMKVEQPPIEVSQAPYRPFGISKEPPTSIYQASSENLGNDDIRTNSFPPVVGSAEVDENEETSEEEDEVEIITGCSTAEIAASPFLPPVSNPIDDRRAEFLETTRNTRVRSNYERTHKLNPSLSKAATPTNTPLQSRFIPTSQVDWLKSSEEAAKMNMESSAASSAQASQLPSGSRLSPFVPPSINPFLTCSPPEASSAPPPSSNFDFSTSSPSSSNPFSQGSTPSQDPPSSRSDLNFSLSSFSPSSTNPFSGDSSPIQQQQIPTFNNPFKPEHFPFATTSAQTPTTPNLFTPDTTPTKPHPDPTQKRKEVEAAVAKWRAEQAAIAETKASAEKSDASIKEDTVQKIETRKREDIEAAVAKWRAEQASNAETKASAKKPDTMTLTEEDTTQKPEKKNDEIVKHKGENAVSSVRVPEDKKESQIPSPIPETKPTDTTTKAQENKNASKNKGKEAETVTKKPGMGRQQRREAARKEEKEAVKKARKFGGRM